MSSRPKRILDAQPVTGLPGGVKLRGIDFRPATGDLYGVGSDSVVYRVNPFTAIAVPEGPSFTPALRGDWAGVGFNPTVDLVRVVTDQRHNLAVNVDPGQVMAAGRVVAAAGRLGGDGGGERHDRGKDDRPAQRAETRHGSLLERWKRVGGPALGPGSHAPRAGAFALSSRARS